MTRIFDIDDDGELPDDVKSLDRELSAIRYEERPSFGPELRAELARAWAREPARQRAAFRRHLVAATLAALLVGGAAVPSARASLVRLIGVIAPDAALLETSTAAAASSEVTPETTGWLAPPPESTVEPPRRLASPAAAAVPTPHPEAVVFAPQMIDREGARELLAQAYPRELQLQGAGGIVGLRLWVDAIGVVGGVEVASSSGMAELDRVAVAVAPRFTFTPASQGGRAVGTWIEFPVVFEPSPVPLERSLAPLMDPLRLPTVPPDEAWHMNDPLDLEALPARMRSFGVDEDLAAAERSLGVALGDPSIIDRFGPARMILAGEAPEGVGATAWRAGVGSALESALERGVENPASLLAFGRIRMRQGLRTEARTLFERGLALAARDDAEASRWVVAELHHERGTLVRDRWLASDRVGRVSSEAFEGVECPRAGYTGGGGSRFASGDQLIAWNYVCPRQLTTLFETGFTATDKGSAGDLTLMMASFRAAIDAYPAHVGANTDLLVTLASEQRWNDVLAGARRFTRVSGGHPNGLLLSGLALHRLDRTREAMEHFAAALERMPAADADELTDIGALLDRAERRWYRRLPTEERRSWEADFWAKLDRAPSTPINERWVEHMARSAFAHLRYGSVFGDASEVWVRFGGPRAIHLVDDGSGRLTEFWDYGSGPDITFVRWASSERTDLTPEGRAYVDDLGKIIPPQ